MQERKVNSLILSSLIKSNVINDEDLNVYEYGLEIFKLYTFTLVMIFIISLLTDTFFETILLFLNFLIIRIYSGGLHLNSKYLCLLFSVFCFVVFPLIFKYYYFNPILNFPAIMLLGFIITKYCPIQSKNKVIDDEQCELFKKKNYIALFSIVIELIIFYCLKQYIYSNVVTGSLLMNTINILLGHYIN